MKDENISLEIKIINLGKIANNYFELNDLENALDFSKKELESKEAVMLKSDSEI